MGWLTMSHYEDKALSPKQLVEAYSTHKSSYYTDEVPYLITGSVASLGHLTLLWEKNPEYKEDLKVPGFFEVVLTMTTKDTWGYKDMDECCGPNKGTASLKMLRRAEEIGAYPRNAFAMSWRKGQWDRFQAKTPEYLEGWETYADSCEGSYVSQEEYKAYIKNNYNNEEN